MKTLNRGILPLAVCGIVALALRPETLRAAALPNSFVEHDLVSDLPGRADHTDPHLANPWGVAFSATSPFWVADNHTGVSTLYNGEGEPFPLPPMVPLVVTIPSPADAPTGLVFNGGGAFNGDRFIFASEGGGIAGWRGALGTAAEILFDNSGAGAIYKGLALATIGSDSYLYASDFHNNRIDVFPSTGAPALSGSFTDPNIPAGFAPFNIQNLGGELYVTYAKQGPGGVDDDPGPGNGFVDIFHLNGDLDRRLVSDGALNSPWGLTFAPSGFGPFGGDLLVGNFGDGRINVYDPSTGALIDHLKDVNGNPLAIEGLWALTFGNGGNGGDTDELYATAGIEGEDHGLFAEIANHVPENGGTGPLLGIIVIGLFAWRSKGTKINLKTVL